MKCKYCNHENPEGEVFCADCGMKLEGASPAASPPPAPVQPPEPAVPAEPGGVRCENCGVMNPVGAATCSNCSQPFAKPTEPPVSAPPGQPPAVCPQCGFDKNPPTAKFCMSCGAQITPAAPPGQVPPPAGPPPPAPPGQVPPPAGPPPPAPPHPAAKLVLPNMKEIPISGPGKRLGREDFLLVMSPEEAKFISREHLEITYENGRYYIADENSTNGTILNGVEIKGQGKKELNVNDEIVLADTVKVRFQT
jgi:hypothetical protein